MPHLTAYGRLLHYWRNVRLTGGGGDGGVMAEVVAPRSRRTESVPRPATSLPRSLMSRFSTGHLVMIVAGLLGLLLTVAVLRHADERQPVAVAARDLAPGTALTESSVRYERVKM